MPTPPTIVGATPTGAINMTFGEQLVDHSIDEQLIDYIIKGVALCLGYRYEIYSNTDQITWARNANNGIFLRETGPNIPLNAHCFVPRNIKVPFLQIYQSHGILKITDYTFLSHTIESVIRINIPIADPEFIDLLKSAIRRLDREQCLTQIS